MNTHPVILFDGICNLCNGAVQFVIQHDAKVKFLFASLQSEAGQALQKQYHIAVEDVASVILVQDGLVYTKSTAALKIAKQLKSGWKLLYAFIIVPAFIRNGVYDIIAANRYKWFGKKEACMLPTPALKARFL